MRNVSKRIAVAAFTLAGLGAATAAITSASAQDATQQAYQQQQQLQEQLRQQANQQALQQQQLQEQLRQQADQQAQQLQQQQQAWQFQAAQQQQQQQWWWLQQQQAYGYPYSGTAGACLLGVDFLCPATRAAAPAAYTTEAPDAPAVTPKYRHKSRHAHHRASVERAANR